MNQNTYTPGVCNIGTQETKYRRKIGWIGLIVTIIIFGILVWSAMSPLLRLLLILPATISAAGFLQARAHFCFAYAEQGIHNFNALGDKQSIEEQDARKKDKKRGRIIILQALLIGILIGIAATLI